MTLEYFMTYFLVVLLATITPGPSMLLAVNQGLHYGVKRTIPSAIGNVLGNLIIAGISLMGLKALLVISGVVFSVVKLVGAGYLCYIGIRLFVESPVPYEGPGSGDILTQDTKTASRMFMDGFFIAVANPKGILFFTQIFFRK